jgi:hypothetical protein
MFEFRFARLPQSDQVEAGRVTVYAARFKFARLYSRLSNLPVQATFDSPVSKRTGLESLPYSG